MSARDLKPGRREFGSDRWATKTERRRDALALGLPLYVVCIPRPRKVRLGEWGSQITLRHTFDGTRAWVQTGAWPVVKRPTLMGEFRKTLLSDLLLDARYPKDASPAKGGAWWRAWTDRVMADAGAWGADDSRWQDAGTVLDGRPIEGQRIVIDRAWIALFDTADAVLTVSSLRFEFADVELATVPTPDADLIDW